MKTQNFNASPYYDDYDTSKKFHRILFNPGFAVQARELTQLQTLLQAQVGRHADHIFANGSVVQNGQTFLDIKYSYVKLQSNQTWSATTATWQSQIQNQIVTGGTSGAKAKVLNYNPAIATTLTGTVASTGTATITGTGTKFLSELEVGSHLTIGGIERTVATITSNTSLTINPHQTTGAYYSTVTGVAGSRTDPGVLFVQYLTGGSTTTAAIFSPSEVLSVNGYTATVQPTDVELYPTAPTGTGSAAHIDEGIYYVDGFFVLVSQQTLVLNKFNATPSYRIGLTKTESLIDHTDDTSLLDPAQGSHNYLAPGAHRYKILLTLAKKRTSATDDGDFFELLRVSSGVIESHVKYPIYSEIENTLARRTFDESGNYTVRPFGIHFETISGDTSNLNAKLSPGKAYVYGHEFETNSSSSVTFAKARTSESISGADTYCKHGGYFIVDELTGTFRTDIIESVKLTTNAGVIIGTAKVRHVLHDSGVKGTTNATYKLYIFDISYTSTTLTQDDVVLITSTGGGSGSAHISDSGRIGSVSSGAPILFETTNNALVWRTSSIAIKRGSIENVSYQTRKMFTAQPIVNGVISMVTGSATQDFFGAGTTLTDDQKNTHFHVVAATVTNAAGTGIGVGDVIDFTTPRTITITGAGTGATLDIGGGAFQGTANIIATIENDEATGEQTRTKTLVSGNTTAVSGATDLPNGQIVIATGYAALGITNPPTLLSLGVADVHELVAVYEDAGTVDIDTVSGTNIASSFILDNGQRDNLYDHASIRLKPGETAPTGNLLVVVDYFTHTGSGYFTQESYEGSGLTDDYADIPRYVSPTTGETIELRDAVDFRPRRDDGVGTTTIPNNMMPYPGTAWEADYDYYLPRIDKVYLDENRNFGIVTGNPSLTPVEPNDMPRAMTLYTLDVPAYTFDPTNITTTFHDNRRYTMRDIGAIDKRVRKVEYYTSLNMLEKAATDLVVLDDAGLNRFKNGILVDPFRGHNIGDVNNEHYTCSIDFAKSELRPPFSSSSVDMRESYSSGASTNVTNVNEDLNTGDLITLPYTSVDFISQTQASKSINVNPFNMVSFVGTMTMDPPSDVWHDTDTRPDVIINDDGINDSWQFSGNDTSSAGFGTQWGDWNTIWTGEEITGSDTKILRSKALRSQRQPMVVNRETVSVTANQTRTGIRTTLVPETIQDEIGGRIVDRSVIPFIRAQNVTISAKGMKPNTRVYPFFDGADVSTVCNSGAAIYTDSAGSVSFTFAIPGGTYRSGERMFRLIDESTNTVADATTHAEEVFQALGTIDTRQSTRRFTIRREVVTDVRTVNNVIERERVIKWYDPLAQTFLVDAKAFPRGICVSQVDLYFASKPTLTGEQLPITVQIRKTENGFPTQEVVPFSTVVKAPSAVSVAASDATYASTATTFTFDSPVFLPAGEYALVVLSNSQDYAVYVAEMGQDKLGTTRTISKQPYAGVLFKSQNASTWSPVQTEDLTFVLRRCSFTSLSGTAVFQNPTGTPAATVRMDVMQLGVEEIQQDNATISWAVKTTGQGGGALSDWTNLIPNEDHLHAAQQEVTSTTGSLLARATLTSDNEAVSPIIDVKRLHVITAENLINNFSTGETNAYPTLPDGAIAPDDSIAGGPRARYITRRVNLADESNSLRVYLTAYRPPGSSIDVYYKILSPLDGDKFDDKNWVQLTQVTSANLVSANESQDYEYEYSPSQALTDPETGITYSDGTATYSTFNQFAIKIVMRSSNSTKVPRIRDLRAIALAPAA